MLPSQIVVHCTVRFTYLYILSITYSLFQILFIYLYLFTYYLLISYLFIYLFTYLFIYLFIYSLIYWSILFTLNFILIFNFRWTELIPTGKSIEFNCVLPLLCADTDTGVIFRMCFFSFTDNKPFLQAFLTLVIIQMLLFSFQPQFLQP